MSFLRAARHVLAARRDPAARGIKVPARSCARIPSRRSPARIGHPADPRGQAPVNPHPGSDSP